ncbi:MAG: transaldolase [Rhodospirillales bacterium]|nr:transaldolase [Rhodospirillales bacterium]
MLESLKVRIFADGADLDHIRMLAANPLVKGFTTNPTLMRKAGVADYERFGRDLLATVIDRPVSLEVFADDFPTMIAQAEAIASWGANAVIKIPITTTRGEFCGPVIRALVTQGIAVNVTAMLTLGQVARVTACLDAAVPAILSVFAGRIADTGHDPVPVMRRALEMMAPLPKAQLLWASPRELLNVFQADEIGCHIITVTSDLLAKLSMVGRDLEEYSLDTVRMFHRDATASNYSIQVAAPQARVTAS